MVRIPRPPHQLGAFLVAKNAKNFCGKLPNQPPVYQMRMIGRSENTDASSILSPAINLVSAGESNIDTTRRFFSISIKFIFLPQQ
ncbi:MAG: hypothetical protein U0989_06770 [Azonexus sp.]|nr:hypothetical protein [Azonexus sp.]MDZ4314452.1 hypothetical protein [Azonexus sp.]